MRLLELSLVLLLVGCGGTTRIGFFFNPGSAAIDGVVSAVNLSIIGNADGTKVTVTAVTLVNVGLASSINLCGDQRALFPIDHFVTAVFDPGASCGTLVSVRSP